MKLLQRVLFTAILLIYGLQSTPAQVTNLAITKVGNQTALIWPASTPYLILQSTTNLSSSNWVAVTDSVPVIAVTVSNNLSVRYFRLFNPASASTAGFAYIPAGSFTMGDTFGEGNPNEVPTVSVNVSAFFIETNLVSYGLWQSVYAWGSTHGYIWVNAGNGLGTNHPVQTLDWYDCIKWCNARSQKLGLTPVYYTEPGLTNVYTYGETDSVYPNWSANGYRLPTEAEWEKAARGGASGQRFPFGNTISESLANYVGFTGPSGGYVYDLGPNGYNALYASGSSSLNTSPTGSFAPNAYGLYDMSGNVLEWCFDWSFSYLGGTDPHGPSTGDHRILRGGSWQSDASGARCARRWPSSPQNAYKVCGFRCVVGGL